MKTVADFKRRLVPGARVRVTQLRTNPLTGKIPPASDRVVARVLAKQFTTKTEDGREIWCQFPTKRDFRIDGPNTVTLLDSDLGGPGEPFVTFEFLE